MSATCGAVESYCVCGEPEGHVGPHVCSDHERCNGSWYFDLSGQFRIHRMPKAATEDPIGDLMDALLTTPWEERMSTPHTRHAAGRWRHEGSMEWFDLIDSVEAARILAETPTAPLNFTKLYGLQARGFIETADSSAATGPRFYRGDVERFARIPLEPAPEVDPMKPAKGVLLACALGAALLGIVGLNVWWWLYR